MSHTEQGFEVHRAEPSIIEIELDGRVYHLEAIKRAAYKFGDRFHIEIELPDDHHVRVVLEPKKQMSDAAFQAGEFRNEVLDQELREMVARETEPLRNVLLAQAFSATSLVDESDDAADWTEDPLKIAQADSGKDKSRHIPYGKA